MLCYAVSTARVSYMRNFLFCFEIGDKITVESLWPRYPSIHGRRSPVGKLPYALVIAWNVNAVSAERNQALRILPNLKRGTAVFPPLPSNYPLPVLGRGSTTLFCCVLGKTLPNILILSMLAGRPIPLGVHPALGIIKDNRARNQSGLGRRNVWAQGGGLHQPLWRLA